MELAVYRVEIAGAEDRAALAGVRRRLDAADAPRVEVREDGPVVTFTADTWLPMLESRVRDAFAAERSGG